LNLGQLFRFRRVSKALHDFCDTLTGAYAAFDARGHPMEIGHDFLEEVLPGILKKFNAGLPEGVAIPTLAALVCCSPFDLALHDAYGIAHGVPTYSTYGAPWMNRDLSAYVTPAADAQGVSEAEALAKGMEEKSKEFREKGGEIYQ
jgi:L-alanine-DL-glutamate epimerase-like enolase superfamily enzyme